MGATLTGLTAIINAQPAVEGAQKFNMALDSMADKADSALGKVNGAVSRIASGIFNLKNLIAGLGLARVAEDVMASSMAFDRINVTLRAATGSAAMASVQYGELRTMARQLALDLPVVAQQFAQMSAAAKGTTLEGAGVEKIFRAISMASRALNLDSQHTEFALYAVQQMISKGTVSMEELRRQLGDNLPGAFQLAAQAAGMNTREFQAAIRQGKILSSDLLPKLADVLEQRYGKAAQEAAGLTQGLVAQLKTSLFEAKVAIAHSGLGEAFDNALRSLNEFITSDKFKQLAKEIGGDLGTAVNLLVKGLIALADNWTIVRDLGLAFIGIKFVSTVGGWVTQLIAFKRALVETAVAQKAVQLAMSFTGSPSAGMGVFSNKGAFLPKELAGLLTSKGALLNTAQFAMKAGAGNVSRDEQIGYDAVQFLTGKGGAVLNQGAVNARLASQAYKDLSAEAKLAVDSLAKLNGVVAEATIGTKLVGWLQSVAGGFLEWAAGIGSSVLMWGRLAALNPEAAIAAILTGVRGLLALIPVWGWIAAAILTVMTSLYLFRDNLITLGGHTAKLRDYMGVLWDAVKDGASAAWDKLKEMGSWVKDTFSPIWEYFGEKARGAWHWLEDLISKIPGVKEFAERAENRGQARDFLAANGGNLPTPGSLKGPVAPDALLTNILYGDARVGSGGKAGIDVGADPNAKGKKDSLKQYIDDLNISIKFHTELLKNASVMSAQDAVAMDAQAAAAKRLNDMMNGASLNDQKRIAGSRNRVMELAAQEALTKSKADATVNARKMSLSIQEEISALQEEQGILNNATVGTRDYKAALATVDAELDALAKTRQFAGKLDVAQLEALQNEEAQRYALAKSIAEQRHQLELFANKQEEAANLTQGGKDTAAALAQQQSFLTRRLSALHLQDNGPLLNAQAQDFARKKTSGLQANTPAEMDALTRLRDQFAAGFKQDALNKATEALNEYAAGVQKSTDSIRFFVDQKMLLDKAFSTKGGLINPDEYKRALRDLTQAYDKAVDDQLMKTQTMQGGFLVAMREMSRAAQDHAALFKAAFTNAIGSIENEMTSFLDTGKFSFSNILNSIRHELDTVAVKTLTGALAGAVLGKNGNASGKKDPGGFLSSILGAKRDGSTPTNAIYTLDANKDGIQGTLAKLNKKDKTGDTASAVDNLGKAASKTSISFGSLVKGFGGILQNFVTGLMSSGGQLLGLIGTGVSAFLGTVAGHLGGKPATTSTATDSIPGFANGGIMTSYGKLSLSRYANGGVAYGPQLALFGEGRRPEAYVPLPDGRSIPVSLRGSTGGQVIHEQTVIYNQSSHPVKATTNTRFDGARFVKDIIIEDLNSEGDVAQTMRGYLGMAR
jgi:lambda family phage tail tape measure protein